MSYTNIRYSDLGTVDSNGIGTGVTGHVLRGDYECTSIQFYQRGFWKNELNLFDQSGLCIIARKESVPLTEKLYKIFTVAICTILLTFFISLTILLAYLLKINHVEAAMDLVRGIVGVSMVQIKPNTKLSRLILMLLMFAFIILCCYVQSLISAVLTIPSSRPIGIKVVSDLLKENYTIYSHKNYFHLFRDTPLDGNIKPIKHFSKCLELVARNASAACVYDCNWAKDNMRANHTFHVIKDESFNKYMTLLFRDDSPLLNQARNIFKRLLEHGLIRHINNLNEFMFNVASTSDYKDITIDQLRYAFYFLMISHGLSTLIFVAEFGFKHRIILKFIKILQKKYNG